MANRQSYSGIKLSFLQSIPFPETEIAFLKRTYKWLIIFIKAHNITS